MKRAIFAIIFTLALTGMRTAKFTVQVAKAQQSGTIAINADGTITPATAPISNIDNTTYSFTDNVTDETVLVQKNNIVLDGAGHTLKGNGVGAGIELFRTTNVTIQNMRITGFGQGVMINSSSNNIIIGNELAANGLENINLIALGPAYPSDFNVISGNNVTASSGNGVDSAIPVQATLFSETTLLQTTAEASSWSVAQTTTQSPEIT